MSGFTVQVQLHCLGSVHPHCSHSFQRQQRKIKLLSTNHRHTAVRSPYKHSVNFNQIFSQRKLKLHISVHYRYADLGLVGLRRENKMTSLKELQSVEMYTSDV